MDIQGLNITVTSSSAKTVGGKGKTKATKSSEGNEVLSNAKLRLKAGQRYALVGKNGSGKSTLLKAIAEKLIPGIPEQTRIAILQQTDADAGGGGAGTGTGADADADADADASGLDNAMKSLGSGRPVLEDIIDRATSKDELEREISILTDGVNSTDGIKSVRALRKVQHERMQKRLFILDKMARLRSGARGMQARKELLAFEKEVAAFTIL